MTLRVLLHRLKTEIVGYRRPVRMARGKPKVLIIGHSHVDCLAHAIAQTGRDDFLAINLRSLAGVPFSRLARRVVETAPTRHPDAVVVCVGGNQHNALGIVENPRPFSIGDMDVPNDHGAAPTRTHIPYHVMRSYFASLLQPELIHDLFEAFPGARRFYLNPPPPLGDWSHLQRNPGIFRAKISLGPPPPQLQMQLYRVQTDVLRGFAMDEDAEFLEAGPPLTDGSGFLAPPYYAADPTHGNAAYGTAMLDVIAAGLAGHP